LVFAFVSGFVFAAGFAFSFADSAPDAAFRPFGFVFDLVAGRLLGSSAALIT